MSESVTKTTSVIRRFIFASISVVLIEVQATILVESKLGHVGSITAERGVYWNVAMR